MGNIGMGELLLIFMAVLLIFGAKRIPEIARGLGKGIREFKDATQDIKRELNIDDNNYYRVPPRQNTVPSYAANTQPRMQETASPVAATTEAPPSSAPGEPLTPQS